MTTPVPAASADAFKALAHPLRIRMLNLLGRSPATSATLARELGESTGSTSYHLRQLARHGLIEEDPDRGTARERWWKPAGTGLTISPEVLFQDVDAARILTETTLTEWHLDARRAAARLLTGELPRALADVSTLSRYTLVATPEDITAAFEAVDEILSPLFSTDSPDPTAGTVRVVAQLIAFPED